MVRAAVMTALMMPGGMQLGRRVRGMAGACRLERRLRGSRGLGTAMAKDMRRGIRYLHQHEAEQKHQARNQIQPYRSYRQGP